MTFDMSAVDNLARSSGGPVVKFNQIGDTCKLRLTGLEERPQTDFTSGQPITWADGTPKTQFVFTGEDIMEGSATYGETVRLFAKGFMLGAIKEALQAANAKPAPDGILAVVFDREEPASKPGLNPAKKYRAQYKPPAPAAFDTTDII